MSLNFPNITALWPMCTEKKNRDDYLPMYINDPKKVSKSQMNCAKEAILWLLSKTPHTVYEIAEHYALSPELVKFLIEELVRSGMLTGDNIDIYLD